MSWQVKCEVHFWLEELVTLVTEHPLISLSMKLDIHLWLFLCRKRLEWEERMGEVG